MVDYEGKDRGREKEIRITAAFGEGVAVCGLEPRDLRPSYIILD